MHKCNSGRLLSIAVVLFNLASITASAAPKKPPRLEAALLQAVYDGNAEHVESLLAQGANPNFADRPGEYEATPLNSAARDGYTKVVKLLLAHGAHIDAPGEDGSTPIVNASDAGQTETVRLLLKNGANVKGTSGVKALIRACFTSGPYGDQPFEIVKLLVKYGVNVNAWDSHGGTTALMIASTNGNYQAIRYLIAHGARVDTRDSNKATALIQTAEVMHEGGGRDCDARSAGILIAHGANIDAQDNMGRTPLMCIALVDYDAENLALRFAKLLVSHGAHIETKDKHGMTARLLAQKNHLSKLAAYLRSLEKKRAAHAH